jgi:hypothetical protein
MNHPRRHLAIVLFSFVCSFASGIAEASEISLKGAAVVVDVGEASYVHYTVKELRQQIKAIGENAPVLYYDLEEAMRQPGPLVVVGRAMSERLAIQAGIASTITDQDPGPQGFTLKSVELAGNRKAIVAAGSDSAGTNYAVMHLRQLMVQSPSGVSVSSDLDVREKPRYQQRGLYLHQHWRYNYPYATWAWSVEDWKRALDMAAYLRVNVVMLWPHMDMIAPPLSVEERGYLADMRTVIDYAHAKRGIKIWMVEGANVVLDSPQVKRLPLESRDYYVYANMEGGGLKNPRDPKGMAALMANREALYRGVPNADAYGYIDSDPGGWLGSPASDFVDLFVENRKLLDRYHERPSDAKLFYWLLASWGTETAQQNWRDATSQFEKRVAGPKEYLVCWLAQLNVARDLGVLEKSTFFPYGVIEGEPTFPLTGNRFSEIGQSFDYASEYKGLEGTMGNVQTLPIQLPNIYYFTRSSWSAETQKLSELSVLRDLALLLFPEKAEMLSQAWAQLKQPGSAGALALAETLQAAVQTGQTGRLGALGAFVFPEPIVIMRDLATMLRIHADAELVREQVAAGRPQQDVLAGIDAYFRAMLDWQKVNGFWGAYGVNKQVIYDRFMHGPDYQTVKTAWQQYVKDGVARGDLEKKIVADLSGLGYSPQLVNSFTGQLFGTYRVNNGEIEKKIFVRLPPWKDLDPWLKEH